MFGRALRLIAGGRKGRRRHAKRAAEPRRGVRSEVDVRHKCRGLKRAVFGRALRLITSGREGRRRLAVQAAEPARIVELPAKIKIILQTIYHAISRHLRARFAFLISSRQAKTQPNGWAIAWWEEVDSNHRSRRQQIYSLLPLATRESSHGAGERNRTINLLITNQLLCLLSYTSISGAPA